MKLIGEIIRECDEKNSALVRFLLDGREQQLSLFDDDRLRILVESIRGTRQGVPLYQTWTQTIGEKERRLAVPKQMLKEFISEYVLPLIKSVRVHDGCHGGERGWSVEASLRTHLPCRSALSFDLKSAYENVKYSYVYEFFKRLAQERGFEDDANDIAKFLAFVSTIDYDKNKRGLPQGSSLSTALFNRLFHPIDVALCQRAHVRGFRYSRWVDDITISSEYEEKQERFLGAVGLTMRYFPISDKKVYFQDRDPIYLLGHKVYGRGLAKNSKEDRLKNKVAPLDIKKALYDKSYELWS